MNEIQRLNELIRKAFPDAKIDLTAPLHDDGVWSLDIDLDDQHLAVEWTLGRGFGVSSARLETFAERPDEFYASLEEVNKRLDQLMSSAEETSPPLTVLISRLRERRGLTQQDLASKLGVKQATISGMERRTDIQLSTLRRVIEAFGGCLEVLALFPDCKYRIGLPSSGSPRRDDNTNSPPIKKPNLTAGKFEPSFEQLAKVGCLERATEKARRIKSHHSVIEFC